MAVVTVTVTISFGSGKVAASTEAVAEYGPKP
jgi:hypothetical protein